MKDFSILALTLSTLVLSGCRIGNYTEPPAGSSMKILALGVEAKEFGTYVIYKDKDAQGKNIIDGNDATPLAGIPASVTGTFHSPVSLVFPDAKSQPFFYNMANGFSLGTAVSGTNIASEADSSIVGLWKNAGCKTQLQIIQEGAYNPNVKETYVNSDGKNAKTDGRLGMDLTVMRVFGEDHAGDCLADFKELAACYQTQNCTQATYDAAQSLYDLYVNYGGFLALDDATLSRIQGLAYIVHFE